MLFTLIKRSTHPSSGFVVVEVHELATLSTALSWEALLLLATVDESLCEAVSIVDVVPAASPDPIVAEVPRLDRRRAATRW